MGTSIEHDENKFLVALFPYQQPIGLDMAFPLPFVVAFQLVGQILFGECASFRKNFDSRLDRFNIQPPLNALSQVFLELVSIINAVH